MKLFFGYKYTPTIDKPFKCFWANVFSTSSSTWITQNNIDNNCFGDRFDARRGILKLAPKTISTYHSLLISTIGFS